MTKKRAKKQINSLLTALEFISCAQAARGSMEQQYCRLFNQWAVASNSIVTAAHLIQEEIQVCPHTKALCAALAQSGQPVLTLNNNLLTVRADVFEANIATIALDKLPVMFADSPDHVIGSRLLESLEIAGSIISSTGEKVINSTVQMLPNATVLATNGRIAMLVFHGFQTPHMIIPKEFVTALSRGRRYTPYRAGWSAESLTIWYEQGAWIKGQLWPQDTPLPDLGWVSEAASAEAAWRAIPDDFFESVDRLKKTSQSGVVFIDDDSIRTESAKISVDNSMGNAIGFEMKDILALNKIATHLAFKDGYALFKGDYLVGAIAYAI